MDRAITLHSDLERSLQKQMIALDDVKTIIKMWPWNYEEEGDRFSCSNHLLEIQCLSEGEEIFIENIFKKRSADSVFLLFDIDGTLLSSRGAGRKAIEFALVEVFGTTGPIASYSFSGKLDPIIIRELMEETDSAGRVSQNQIDTCLDIYAQNLEINLKEEGVDLKPGIRQLLSHLAEQPDIHLALCTGNIPEGAELKLKEAGIHNAFVTGAFGSDASVRNGLPIVAYRRLQRKLLLKGSQHRTVVIGDSPVDISSAHYNGYHSVAVATGVHPREKLKKEDPGLLLDSFEDPVPFLDFLGEVVEKS